MKLLIKKHEQESLLQAIYDLYTPSQQSTNELTVIIQQLKDGIRLSKDIHIKNNKASRISQAIEKVYKVPYSKFTRNPDRIVIESKDKPYVEQLITELIQQSKIESEKEQVWEVTFCNDDLSKEVVRVYAYEPSTQYLNSECKFLGVNRCIVRVK